jgi:hypothetical protein
MGWHPESGFIERNWDGYNEGMALYLLALGSRSHPAKEGAFEAWTAPFPKYWRREGANRYLSFAPHFAHQYGAVLEKVCARSQTYEKLIDEGII